MRNFLIGVFIFWLIIVGLIIDHDKQSAPPKATKETVNSNKTEIVFWHAMGGPLGIVMNKMIDRYNASQTSYHVKSVNMGGYDTLAKKILASLVANEAPDISQNYETLTKKFIRHDKVVCLDELIEQDIARGEEDIRKDIIPVLLENNTFGGKLYSFPFNKSVPVLYYNKDMFKEVGLDPKRPPQTLEEFKEYARKITNHYKELAKSLGGEEGKAIERRDVYGYGCSKANVWGFLNRLMSLGGFIVTRNEDDRLISGFSEEASVMALSHLQEMVKEGIAREGQAFDHQNDFIAGRVGIIESSIISKVFMEDDITFDYGIASLPGSIIDGKLHNGVILSGSNINIFNNNDQKKIDGAWDFVKWFTSTENGAEWSIGTTYLPVRISSVNSPTIRKAKKDDPNLNAAYEQLDFCHFEPRLTAWFEIRDMLADYIEESSLKMEDPRYYCDRMKRDVDNKLMYVLDRDE
jgi:ABC-type glycerol-3-phosphate transport system substrate-binding protein